MAITYKDAAEHKRDIVMHVLKTVLMSIFVLMLISMIVHALLKQREVKVQAFAPLPFSAEREKDLAALYTPIIERYEGKDKSYSSIPTARNMFAPDRKKSKAPFRIKEIVIDPFYFRYQGHLQQSSGMYVAQINWGSKTHFVKAESVIGEWLVASVDATRVILINQNDGGEMVLPINESVYSKKPYAVLIDSLTGKETQVYVNDMVDGYKILDIKKDAVILTVNSESLTITK